MVESIALVLLAYAATLPAKLARRFPVLLPLKVKEFVFLVLFTETSTFKTESAAFLPTLLLYRTAARLILLVFHFDYFFRLI
jgi:hypothetical protein